MSGRPIRIAPSIACALVLLVASPLAALRQSPEAFAVQIMSPLGRTGITGPVRIVARITVDPRVRLSPVQFFVDGKLVGEDKDGPPYAVEWTDNDPYGTTEIVVQVNDSLGRTARDSIELKPLEVNDSTTVVSTLLEALVAESTGHPANGLKAADFILKEDGADQTIDQVMLDPVPATYTLLVDSSQSMASRMDFVREAARELPVHLRADDQMIVAPFSQTLRAITGPTKDRDTMVGAISAIQAGGGTAILDCLASVAKQLSEIQTRHVVVLITDGYDENSKLTFNEALDAIKSTSATVYIVGIGGLAGMSLAGREFLGRIATETGGKAFFPLKDSQLVDLAGVVAADVQQRYLITYSSTNQNVDGTWRSVSLATTDPTRVVRVKSGYRAPSPPPIHAQIELAIRNTNREFVDVGMDDLIVVEDGVEQKVEAFQEALTSVSVVMILDNSGSMRKDAAQVMTAARAFVDALPAKDSLAVMHFADKAEFAHDLSTKRELSLAAIDDYRADGGTALYDALTLGLDRLKTADGKRVVVVLTDGRDENNPGTGPGSTHSFDDVLASLKESGATVFSIGLGPRVDREKLVQLSDKSGGEAYISEDVASLEANYRRVLENLRRRYVIRYTSTNPARDGAWRKVTITARVPGIVVESRGGYFAPAK